MSLPDHPIAGPDRQRQGTMGHKVETGPERVRHHVPRPHPNKMITDQIRSTVYLIDPFRSPEPGAGFGLADLPAGVRFQAVVVAGVGSEVADAGLAGRAALVGAEVGNGVVNVDQPAYCGGVGEDVGGVAEVELFAEPGRDFIAVDRGVAGGEVDHGFQADGAVVAEQGV